MTPTRPTDPSRAWPPVKAEAPRDPSRAWPPIRPGDPPPEARPCGGCGQPDVSAFFGDAPRPE